MKTKTWTMTAMFPTVLAGLVMTGCFDLEEAAELLSEIEGEEEEDGDDSG